MKKIPAFGSCALFQFHFGTIQSFHLQTYKGFLNLHFNSTLVRFRVHTFIFIRQCVLDFNSTLVRFRGNLINPLVYLITIFQFHFGTIQSSNQSLPFANFWLISIPLWYDLEGWKNLIIEAGIIFQFHFGTIQSILN